MQFPHHTHSTGQQTKIPYSRSEKPTNHTQSPAAHALHDNLTWPVTRATDPRIPNSEPRDFLRSVPNEPRAIRGYLTHAVQRIYCGPQVVEYIETGNARRGRRSCAAFIISAPARALDAFNNPCASELRRWTRARGAGCYFTCALWFFA